MQGASSGGGPLKVGSTVKVKLPADVEGWAQEAGAEWVGTVVYINGDSIDVEDPAGNIEPIDLEYVTDLTEGDKP